MKNYFKYFLLLALLSKTGRISAQEAISEFNIMVTNELQQPFENVVVELVRADTKMLVKTALSDKNGVAMFQVKAPGPYYFIARTVGYALYQTPVFNFPQSAKAAAIQMNPAAKEIAEVAVTGRKQFIQRVQGKTIVNVDAAVTNAGTTVLEMLEKSPGVMVDKNGGISLQGKPNVLVMIDDKPTYLSGTELSNLLSSMSTAQVNQIELITSPSAKYDASGNAGIINIKTKKNLQEGFNGNFSANAGNGKYYKNNNSLNLNYRKGKFNTFLNYGVNLNKGFTDIYALRKYFGVGGALTTILDQPTYLTSRNANQSVKTGTDFYAAKNTILGIALSGTMVNRTGNGNASATWLNPAGVVDSAISTYSNSDFKLRNGAINLNLRHTLNKQSDLSFDADALSYRIDNDQAFTNERLGTGGYVTGSVGDIPSSLNIYSVKGDFTHKFSKTTRLEAGVKSSSISTDNIAGYQLFNGTAYQPDLNKSNHFMYRENINAVYGSLDGKWKKISAQVGLRYENTYYNAHQLGNSIKPDSAFSKNYSNIFPSGFLTYEADAANVFTFTAGRRIDRPAYQKLNPFVFIINKYTHQQGNPYFLPQYSWNLELSHSFKDKLITTVSFANIKNYFSQLFLSKGNDILVYTDGNVGSMRNFGVALAAQFQPLKWWSFTGQSVFNYKKLSGYQNVRYASSVAQLHTSMNHQFRIDNKRTAELSGFYTTRARNDLQELLTPTGQVSVGFAQTILKGKGTLKLSGRDIFYTNAMEGLTDFPGANEYFILWRDTQVVNLSFSLKFGKPLKATKRSAGSAGEEINRAG